MSRITTTIFIVMLLLSGSATVFQASGLAADMGVQVAPGVSDSLDSAVSQMQQIQPSAGLGDTLFTLILTLGGLMDTLIKAVGALPTMLTNFGLPSWIVVPLVGPLYAISALELGAILVNRDVI